MSGSCRGCGSPGLTQILDLGEMPLVNRYPEADGTRVPRYPLEVQICSECLLMQLRDVVAPSDLFDDYAYFSSYSQSWVANARAFARTAQQRFALDAGKLVVEVASNDGYLLQHFKDVGVGILGVEPAANVAEVARQKGIPTVASYFDEELALALREEHGPADLMVGNNVLAHVPDIIGFLRGFTILLGDAGVASFEFPHAMNLIAEAQFDTIYHEHYSYLSLIALESVMDRAGLKIFDVERLPTHGGSLRVYCTPATSDRVVMRTVSDAIEMERRAGMDDLATYPSLQARVDARVKEIRHFMESSSRASRLAGYGAAAKATVLINYCGIAEALEFVADQSPHKQGRLIPGTDIRIVSPGTIRRQRPDRVVVFVWNLIDEVRETLADYRAAGGRLSVLSPVIGDA